MTNSVKLVVAVVLQDDQKRILLARRPEGKSMAGLWEFPGGKVGPDEVPEAALVRELEEELGIGVEVFDLRPLTFASHGYADFHLLMPLYSCVRWKGHPKPLEHSALAWVHCDELRGYEMPSADEPLIPLLKALL